MNVTGIQKSTIIQIVMFLLILITDSFSGTKTDNQFPVLNDGIKDSGLVNNGGLTLGIKKHIDVKIFGDSVPDVSKTSSEADLLQKKDTLLIFTADTASGGIYYRKLSILENALAPAGQWIKFSDAIIHGGCFLNADLRNDGYFTSYINSPGNAKKYLRLSTGATTVDIDSTSISGWIYSSQCAMENDTFLVLYSIDLSVLKIVKIYASGSVISKKGEFTIATGEPVPGKCLMTNTVSIDKNDNVFVTWNKGTPQGVNGNKYLHFAFINRQLNSMLTDSLTQTVADTGFYYSHNAGIANYASGKFAVFFWNTDGLNICNAEKSGSTIQKTINVIKSGFYRFCDAKTNGNKVFVLCKGDLDGNGVAGIEGIRYKIIDDTLDNGTVFCLSDAQKDVNTSDRFGTMINCETDTSGTMSAVWKNGKIIEGGLIAYRPIRYQSGFWTSEIDSLNVNYADSLYFLPSDIALTSDASWYIEDSIRTGCTVNECQNASWHSFSDAAVLKSFKGTCRYYQYRIKINRKNSSYADSIISPAVTSIKISWNVIPVITGIDSIQIRKHIIKNVSDGDILNVLSRIDTINVYLRIRDQDHGDRITYNAQWASMTSPQTFMSNGTEKNVSPIILMPLTNDTNVVCKFTVRDTQNWTGAERILVINSRNSVPALNVKLVWSGMADSIDLSGDSVSELDEFDTITIRYSVSDTNDPQTVKGYIKRINGSSYRIIDSISNNGLYKILCDTVSPQDTLRIAVYAADPDTSVFRKVSFVVNNRPEIDSVIYGNKLFANNDTMRLNSGFEATINVVAKDVNLAFWDTLQFRYKTVSANAVFVNTSGKNAYKFTPAPDDSLMDIIVTDKYGKKDSTRIIIKLPWFETDSIKNPLFRRGLDTLQRHISLIDGSSISDTVNLPLINTGNDPLHVTGCLVKGIKNTWLKLIIGKDTITSTDKFDSSYLTMLPDQPVILKCILSAKTLTGDNVEVDTIVITTDEPLHDTILIPVRIEYNDLPVILSVGTDYIIDKPYWSLKKVKSMGSQKFPPHSAIQIQFSEPVDSVSAKNAITVYSVFDSSMAGIITPVNTRHSWSQNHTLLRISADYTSRSSTYNIFPPSGLFIPTDSLSLKLTNRITDAAATPHGPNLLDIHKTFRRDSTLNDTTISMRVDSISFTLLRVTPLPGDSNIVNNNPEIKLDFSAPVYALSVDTSKISNKTLIVTSSYNNNEQLDYDSIGINANSVTFRIARRLFYNDQLHCLYRSISVRDNSGFSVDVNKNGIPAADYDSTSSEDNFSWDYRVRNNRVLSVSPADNSVTKDILPEISISFSAPVWISSFDTLLSSANKSISLNSMYSSKSGACRSIRFSEDSTKIYLIPADTYFSGDSIRCIFKGFTKDYSYLSANNYPHDTEHTFSSFSWSFFTSDVGFYTYPNPYKPGADNRHCRQSGPCGIWFKNLHALKKGITDVSIRIYDMNVNLIYDSKLNGKMIHFETGSSVNVPQWLWNTTNLKKELVASGVYVYCIYDINSKILIKDKLVIVR